MGYFIIAVCLYALSVLWIGYAAPWLDREMAELHRRDRERDRAREEELLRRRREELKRKYPDAPKARVGDFLKFAFPIIRRSSPALIAQNLISVQPMTSPVGRLAFYNMKYANEPHRTILDDIVDALVEAENDPVSVVDDIIRDVFKDCPYSNYYQPSLSESNDGIVRHQVDHAVH